MSQWSTEPLWLVNLREVELVLWMPPDTETEREREREREREQMRDTETETESEGS